MNVLFALFLVTVLLVETVIETAQELFLTNDEIRFDYELER